MQEAYIDPDVFTVRNLKLYKDLDFDKYLMMTGVSYSTIKGFCGEISEGMKLGTRVHQALGEPEKYDWQNAKEVLKIAGEIRKVIGPAFKYMDKEIAFTAEFHYQGFMMIYKGRIDLGALKKIIIDYKVLSGSVQNAIDMFGYDRQLSGYCLATDTPMARIIAWNKNKKQTETQTIYPDCRWWAEKVLTYGYPFKN